MLLLPKFQSCRGCAADGATYTEAVANVEVVIQEWLETAQELGRDICRAPATLELRQ